MLRKLLIGTMMFSSCITAWGRVAYAPEWGGPGAIVIPYPAEADQVFPPRWANLKSTDLQVIAIENIFNPDSDPNFLWARMVTSNNGPRPYVGSGLIGFFDKYNPNRRSVFQQYAGSGGLNWEHTTGVLLSDSYRNSYTPRSEPCELKVLSPNQFQLRWSPGAWPLAVTSTYTLQSGGYVDISFSVLVTGPISTPQVRLMHASYMDKTYDEHHPGGYWAKSLYFGPDVKDQLGREDQIGITPDPKTGKERRQGWVLAGKNSPPLSYLASKGGMQVYDLNLKRWEPDTWTEPTWIGYVDGDYDDATHDPYLLQFEFAEENVELQSYTWSPPDQINNWQWSAWDWSWVLYGPEVGQTYTWHARVRYQQVAGVGNNGWINHAAAWQEAVADRKKWLQTLELPVDENPPVIRFVRNKNISDDLVEATSIGIDQCKGDNNLLNTALEYVVDNESGPIWTNDTSQPGGKVWVTSNINWNKPGGYVATFFAQDKSGNVAERSLPVVLNQARDKTPPRIYLNGKSVINLLVGQSWTDPGATAEDDCNPASPAVESYYLQPLDLSMVGIITVHYRATDQAGNVGTATRTLFVRRPDSRQNLQETWLLFTQHKLFR